MCFRIAHDLGEGYKHAEAREGTLQQRFVDCRIEVADEQVGAHIQCTAITRSLWWW
mgnify:CR=1 FL=1